jgi:hypothetical protein
MRFLSKKNFCLNFFSQTKLVDIRPSNFFFQRKLGWMISKIKNKLRDQMRDALAITI